MNIYKSIQDEIGDIQEAATDYITETVSNNSCFDTEQILHEIINQEIL